MLACMRLTIDPEGLRILVVDDEEYITDLVAVGLRFVGFDVETASDGREALAKIAALSPDLVVLDISMPEIDGVEVLATHAPGRHRRAGDLPHRARCARRPGARSAPRRRRLRDEAVQPRGAAREDRGRSPSHVVGAAAPARLTVGDLSLDREGREVMRDDQIVEMSRTEFNLLEFLMMNVGRVVSKQQILEHVWQYDFDGESSVVETYISYLRKKLDPLGPPMIHTLRGVGYVLRNPCEPASEPAGATRRGRAGVDRGRAARRPTSRPRRCCARTCCAVSTSGSRPLPGSPSVPSVSTT